MTALEYQEKITAQATEIAALKARAEKAEADLVAANALAEEVNVAALASAKEAAEAKAAAEIAAAARDKAIADAAASAKAAQDAEASIKTVEARVVEQLGKLGVSSEDVPTAGDPTKGQKSTLPNTLTPRERLAKSIKVRGIQ